MDRRSLARRSHTPPGSAHPVSKKARARAIAARFDRWYGGLDRLCAHQALCADLGVAVGDSITQCKKTLKTVHVNIFDFDRAMRSGEPVLRFASRAALRRHTLSQRLFFPLELAKEDTMLRALLEYMF